MARWTLMVVIGGVMASALLGATAAASPAPGVKSGVVRCPTVYGLGEGQYKVPALPRSADLPVPPGRALKLSLYSNGWLSLLAPRGWHCEGVVGATGALALDVLPPGIAAKPGLVDRRADAVTATIPSPGTGEVGGDVCAFFPRATPAPDSPCPSRPPAERVVRLSSTAVAFEDPPHVAGHGTPSGGPDPANGIAIYARSKAAVATCTLPEADHAACTVILDEFLARHRL